MVYTAAPLVSELTNSPETFDADCQVIAGGRHSVRYSSLKDLIRLPPKASGFRWHVN